MQRLVLAPARLGAHGAQVHRRADHIEVGAGNSGGDGEVKDSRLVEVEEGGYGGKGRLDAAERAEVLVALTGVRDERERDR